MRIGTNILLSKLTYSLTLPFVTDRHSQLYQKDRKEDGVSEWGGLGVIAMLGKALVNKREGEAMYEVSEMDWVKEQKSCSIDT